MIESDLIIADLTNRPQVLVDKSKYPPVIIYQIEAQPGPEAMFALFYPDYPQRLSLRAEPGLLTKLRTDYETVVPGENLNKNDWNTIILSRQLSWPEIQALINHSYQLVLKKTGQ